MLLHLLMDIWPSVVPKTRIETRLETGPIIIPEFSPMSSIFRPGGPRSRGRKNFLKNFRFFGEKSAHRAFSSIGHYFIVRESRIIARFNRYFYVFCLDTLSFSCYTDSGNKFLHFQDVSRRKDVSPMPRRTNPHSAANSTATNADGVDETITVYSDAVECP